jgi:antitoxin component of MazEF toxin-antitoxin module
LIRKLIKHGNRLALVIDKSILEQLGWRAETPLLISTDGRRLIVSATPVSGRRRRFEDALEEGNRKFGSALKRLGR